MGASEKVAATFHPADEREVFDNSVYFYGPIASTYMHGERGPTPGPEPPADGTGPATS